MTSRGEINGKTDMAAALSKFSNMVTLSHTEGADYDHPLALIAEKIPDY